jgi:hypothetical protein
MLNSVVITVSIARPYAEVYDFCADPMNFGRRNALPGAEMEPVGGTDYKVELPQGRRIMRFMRRNPYGILDYEVFNEDGTADGPLRPLRLVRNESGADLQMTWFHLPSLTNERFASEVEWVRSDLLRLKSFLEAGRAS